MISSVWPMDTRLRYWHPVALVSTLNAAPVAVQCCGVPVVLFRSGNAVVAMYDRCAHRRMPLSHGTAGPGGITCPYHGCQFAPDGTGYCPTTKSNRFRVPVFETRILCGVVWLRSPGDGNSDAGFSTGLSDDDHVFACVVEKKIAAPVQLVIDNMTELEHTGAVHRQLAFGIVDFDTVHTACEQDGESVSIFYRGRQRPLPPYLGALMGLRRGDFYVQTARVSFTPPCAAYRIWWTTADGGKTRAFGLRFVNYYTEADRDHTNLFCFVYWKTHGTLLHASPRVAALLFRRLVSAELERDKRIIEKAPRAESTLDWFQLNHFDRPLVATRKLMQRHYMPTSEPRPPRQAPSGTANSCRNLQQAVQPTKGNVQCS